MITVGGPEPVKTHSDAATPQAAASGLTPASLSPTKLGTRIAERFRGVGLTEPLPELHAPLTAP